MPKASENECSRKELKNAGYTHFTVGLIKPPFGAPANLFQLISGSRLTELMSTASDLQIRFIYVATDYSCNCLEIVL